MQKGVNEMSVNKKYFYMKFKEDYFDQSHIKVIESMQNGHTYSLILLKLYLRSLRYDGQLRINEAIPFSSKKIEMLAAVINHDSDHVMKAINLAHSLGIVEILDTGEMFMADIQNFIGHSSTEAERKAAYRQRLNKSDEIKQLDITQDKYDVDKNGTLSQNFPPELELDIELEKELNNNSTTIDKKEEDHLEEERSSNNQKMSPSSPRRDLADKKKYAEHVSLTDKQYSALVTKYNSGAAEMITKLNSYKSWYKEKYGRDKKSKSDYHALNGWVKVWWEEEKLKREKDNEQIYTEYEGEGNVEGWEL